MPLSALQSDEEFEQLIINKVILALNTQNYEETLRLTQKTNITNQDLEEIAINFGFSNLEEYSYYIAE